MSKRRSEQLLFEVAKTAGLMHSRNVLVKRLKSAVGPTLPRKYASDIGDLSYALKNWQPVPHALLKNGKHSATVFVTSKNRQVPTTLSHVDNCVSSSCSLSPVKCPVLAESTEHSAPCANSVPLLADSPPIPEVLHPCSQLCETTLTQPGNTVAPADPCHYHDNSRAITAQTRDLSNLRCDLTLLRPEVANLRCSPPPNASETCSLYVKIKQHTQDEVTNLMLSDILGCPILSFTIIRRAPAVILRVKILNIHLHTVLTKPDSLLVTVRAWKVKPTHTNFRENIDLREPPPNLPGQRVPHSNLKIVTWNCRGLSSGEPCIHHLAEEGYDIIAITEHWLWPYEAERLCIIHPSFTAEVKTDSRLNENSTLQRGCGGVGLMWRKTLNATPVSSISSDRICGLSLKLSLPEPTEVSILGVYLPCMDMGIECYCNHLVELEHLISQRQQLGPSCTDHR